MTFFKTLAVALSALLVLVEATIAQSPRPLRDPRSSRAPRSGDESALESCFQSSRIADAICSKLPDDSALRPDCFQKTRSAEFECLEHALSETPAATLKTPSEATRLEPPGSGALPERSSEHNSPPAQIGTWAGIPSAKRSNSPPNAIVRVIQVAQRRWRHVASAVDN